MESTRENTYVWKEHAVEWAGGCSAHHTAFAGTVQAPVLVGQLPSVCKAAATALLESPGDGAEQQRIPHGPAPRPGLGVSGFLPQASAAPGKLENPTIPRAAWRGPPDLPRTQLTLGVDW